MSQKYGHLNDDGSEYIITTPRTPRPWINYLTNGDYSALCSHVGGGFSFYKDHRYHSILRRGAHVQLDDLPARLWYIKDEGNGDTWTANHHPIGVSDTFEARHGMGYTTIQSSANLIDAQARYFVPPNVDAELWTMTLTNKRDVPVSLSIYSLAEFVLGNVSLDQHESQIMALFNEVEEAKRTLILRKTWWHTQNGWAEVEGHWPKQVFLTTSQTPTRMLTDRNIFLGPFRGYHNPAALEPELLPDGPGSGKDLVGVYQWRIELAPGEFWSTQIAIGILPETEDAATSTTLLSLQDSAAYEDAWQQTTAYWHNLCSGLRIATPDPQINAMINWWNKLQVMVNFHFGRGPSYYHKGQYPAMRDSCQDAFGVMPLAPKLVRAKLLRIAGFFFADGAACGGCNRIDLPEDRSIKVDLPLWFVLVVLDYLRETGDLGILDELVPLMDGGESTVLEKMLAGVDRMIDERGPHGLPLIGQGDWNDAANAIGTEGRGESVWLAQFLYFVIQQFLPLLKDRKLAERVSTYSERAEEIREIVNASCWNGDWYVRAFKDDGSPVGVKGQAEGAIWINSQTWAVISDISPRARLEACLDSVEAHMGSAWGLTNLAPGFSKPDETIGLITRFRKGWKENAAVFSHASSFNVVARALLGRGSDAIDLFRRLLPLGKDPDLYCMEPYVYSQFVVGPDCPEEHGRGCYHWLTGTAAWMLRAMSDYIIGVRAEWDGIRIAPALDPAWPSVSMERTIRGSRYCFQIENPDGVESGVRTIELDGTPISGTLLPFPTAPTHGVKIIMGTPG